MKTPECRLTAHHFLHNETLHLVRTLNMNQIKMGIVACKQQMTGAALKNQPHLHSETWLPRYEAALIFSREIERATGKPVLAELNPQIL